MEAVTFGSWAKKVHELQRAWEISSPVLKTVMAGFLAQRLTRTLPMGFNVGWQVQKADVVAGGAGFGPVSVCPVDEEDGMRPGCHRTGDPGQVGVYCPGSDEGRDQALRGPTRWTKGPKRCTHWQGGSRGAHGVRYHAWPGYA